jgi:hypothetical protein
MILSACTTVQSTPAQISIPADLREPCPNPAAFAGVELRDLVIYHFDLIDQYLDCRAKHAAVIEALPEPK